MIDFPQLKRVREIFPKLEIKSARANLDGLTNDVLIVNDDLVFRFPKNETWARELLANEMRVVELLKKYVDLPLPQFEYKAADVSVHRFIRGKPLCRHDILKLNKTEQARIAGELGAFLRQMHNVSPEEIKINEIGKSDTSRSREKWLILYENARKELFPLMMPHVREMTEEHFAPLLKDEDFMDHTPRLMNGDFVPYHILYDEANRRITGVIDFGTAGTGDAAGDFSCIIYNYGESFLRKMARAAYPEISEGIDRARFWAGTLELQWALSGIRLKNDWWHLVHLSAARDANPIGSKF